MFSFITTTPPSSYWSPVDYPHVWSSPTYFSGGTKEWTKSFGGTPLSPRPLAFSTVLSWLYYKVLDYPSSHRFWLPFWLEWLWGQPPRRIVSGNHKPLSYLFWTKLRSTVHQISSLHLTIVDSDQVWVLPGSFKQKMSTSFVLSSMSNGWINFNQLDQLWVNFLQLQGI